MTSPPPKPYKSWAMTETAMSLNETMDRLRQQIKQPTPEPPLPVKDEPMTLPDEMPTMRDLSTALYKINNAPKCRNCIRRERGDCPSKTPLPKTCHSFQLNSKQMQTYGKQARNVITAWREAIAIHTAREHYRQLI